MSDNEFAAEVDRNYDFFQRTLGQVSAEALRAIRLAPPSTDLRVFRRCQSCRAGRRKICRPALFDPIGRPFPSQPWRLYEWLKSGGGTMAAVWCFQSLCFRRRSRTTPIRSEVVDALIDTGATGTGVRPDIAAKLHVRGRGRRLVSTANGDMLVPEFRLRLGFYPGFFNSQASASSATMPTILDFGVNAHALREGFAYALLIGMDILSKCDFSMDRSGSCSLAFG